MIGTLDEKQCYDLLGSTTVGRIGFVRDARVEIIPVNYALSGRDLILHTAPDGILRSLADEGAAVAFEVDHHTDLAGSGWSVLLQATLALATPAEESAARVQVSPWAGADRDVALRLAVSEVSGRRVRRDPRD